MTLNEKWDLRFLAFAHHISFWSKDPSTKVGCVISNDERDPVTYGYNGFPPQIADTTVRLHDRALKYRLVQHAERNAMDRAKVPLAGMTLYVTQIPCSDQCMKSILTKRIARIVCPDPFEQQLKQSWLEDAKLSYELAREAGIEITHYPLERIRIDGGPA